MLRRLPRSLLLSFVLLLLIGAGAACHRNEPAARSDSARSAPAEPAPSALTLAGPWEFRQLPGEPPPPAADGENGWLPATVPGSVHTDLLAAGKIPDPFYGKHEQSLQWIGERDWEYRTRFSLPPALAARERIDLVFEGLDTYASVRLNDQPLLEANNMFRSWRVPVKPWLRPGENTLVVHFRSALREGKAASERLGYALPASNDSGDPRVSMFTRKAPYHFGWDWGPRFVTSGVWRPVRLEAWQDARLADLHVLTTMLSDERAELSVEASIEASRALPARLEVALAGGSLLGSAEALLAPGENRLRAPIVIDRPQRWWPNGLGEPHLYTLQATLSLAGAPHERRQVRVGLRTLEVVHRPDAAGKSFSVLVNGLPVFMKGANYIPQDSFLPRVTPERHERLLRAAAAANMNMLRVWGGGIYEDDRFYELCDELGLLVWQDFMFACSGYPSDAAFLDNVREEARQSVRRLRNHPSLALWAGNNENEWAWRDWGWSRPYSPAQLAEVAAGYRRLFHELLPEVVAAEDPGRFYSRSSPSANDDGIPPNQPGSGDMHYWGVWHSQEPYQKYADNVSRFMSEYGFQSFPELSTILRYAAPEDLRLDSEVMRAHQRHPRGNQLIATYLERDFRAPRDFESFSYVSQVLQATIIQFAAEAHRRKMPYNGGSLYWQLNDCWPVASWSSIDYYGRWKALHHYARRFFAPVLASWAEEAGQLRLYGVSDRRSDSPVMLRVRTLDFDGGVRLEQEQTLRLGANSSHVYFEAPAAELLAGGDPRRTLLVAELLEQGQRLSRSLHYFTSTKELELPDPELELRRGSASDGAIRLEIGARRLARAVRLSSSPPEGSFSDNYFDLLPGERLELEYRGAAGAQLDVRSLRDTY